MQMKAKVEVKRLDGIGLRRTFIVVTKNLDVERRSHKISKRGMTEYKSLRNGTLLVLILLLGKWRKKWLHHLSEAAKSD